MEKSKEHYFKASTFMSGVIVLMAKYAELWQDFRFLWQQVLR
jgi:hypothetical protein